MTTNFMLLNKLIYNRHAYFAVLILATAANPLYVLANFIVVVVNAISAQSELVNNCSQHFFSCIKII